ncbi:hypothetical protein O181_000988 [Austropuccinia psidii MF-1]|uniref:Uncharacterized protein n=1 Tax=Austropuccinia psidii MF-1 TaxID=1389203 RepID=A0A9Q3GBB5_9BASI|nr:hypothetical protein [Austropuccinia psidii MF-1]
MLPTLPKDFKLKHKANPSTPIRPNSNAITSPPPFNDIFNAYNDGMVLPKPILVHHEMPQNNLIPPSSNQLNHPLSSSYYGMVLPEPVLDH